MNCKRSIKFLLSIQHELSHRTTKIVEMIMIYDDKSIDSIDTSILSIIAIIMNFNNVYCICRSIIMEHD